MMKNQQQHGFGVIEIVVALAVVALLGVGGWYVWQAQQGKSQNQTNNTPSSNDSTKTGNGTQTSGSVFKIPELGVEFDVKGGITPLYKIGGVDSTNGTTVSLSTQQIVDKGAVVASGGTNVCKFDPVDLDNSYVVTSFTVYISASDAQKANRGPLDGPRPASELTAQNGFITIGSKIYYVPTGVVSSGNSNCLSGDRAFLSQQWQYVHDSLMTLRAIQ